MHPKNGVHLQKPLPLLHCISATNAALEDTNAAHPQGTDLAENSLGGVEYTAHYPGSRGVADIVSVTIPLLSIKDLAVTISTRAEPAEDDPPLHK